MSDIVERLEAEAQAREKRADFLFRKCADEPDAQMEIDYHQSRAYLVRQAKAEITRLRERDEDVREELADAWPEDREAVLAGDPVALIAKLIRERDEWICDYEATRALLASLPDPTRGKP